ncbi:MAG TPA: glycosyltransferase [Bacillota bacterium]
MRNYRIVGTCQIYNEIRKENLKRFVKYFMPLLAELVVYDDGSTDGSYEYMLNHTPHVIRGGVNDFINERSHKQILLERALELKPDFILWMDADEVLTANGPERLPLICDYAMAKGIDGISFHELNLWRSSSWRRMDSLFNDGWFVRLWQVNPGMTYLQIKPGLHQEPYPSTIDRIERETEVQVLHYGFSSEKRLAYKYLTYQSYGQSGYVMLDRLIDERTLRLEKVSRQLIPKELWRNEPQPTPLSWDESLAYVENFRDEFNQA